MICVVHFFVTGHFFNTQKVRCPTRVGWKLRKKTPSSPLPFYTVIIDISLKSIIIRVMKNCFLLLLLFIYIFRFVSFFTHFVSFRFLLYFFFISAGFVSFPFRFSLFLDPYRYQVKSATL